MRLVRVSAKLKDFEAVKKLYIEAFPPDERAPLWILLKNARKPITDFWAVYDKEKWVGLSYVVKDKGIAYLFYFAVRKDLRGMDYGSRTLKTLLRKYSSYRFFLALEPLIKGTDNYDMRVRRHNFYKRNGFKDMQRLIKEGPVIYAVMGAGGDIEPYEYNDLMRKYMGIIMCKLVGIRMFRRRKKLEF